MSGYADHAIVHHGVLEPGTAFLQKPFTSICGREKDSLTPLSRREGLTRSSCPSLSVSVRARLDAGGSSSSSGSIVAYRVALVRGFVHEPHDVLVSTTGVDGRFAMY